MTLYLVRHAKAGAHDDGELRELTETGLQQAQAIADLLAGVGVHRLYTSRYRRCRQTVAPLAERLGVEPEVHESLCEEADLEDAWTLVEALATAEVDAVVCSHGNLISPMLDRVLRRGADIKGEWSCRTGSVWRLKPKGDLLFGKATLLLG